MSALTDPNFANSKSSEVGTPVGIFDVEGTLIACVAQTLESWRETLADFGLQSGILQIVGTLTGGFSPAILREAGCSSVIETAADVVKAIAQIDLSRQE